MDWAQGVSWAIAVLAVFGSAGWLAGRNTRRIAKLKVEAEVAGLLDAGTAKDRLRQHVDAQVLEYVEDQERISSWWAITYAMAWLALGLSLVVGGVWAALAEDHNPPGAWAFGVIVPCGIMTVAGIRVLWHEYGMSRRLRQVPTGIRGS